MSQIFTQSILMSHKKDIFKYFLDLQKTYEKNQYLMLLICMFNSKTRLIVCSVHYHLHNISLVIKVLLINLKMKLQLLKSNNKLEFAQYVAFNREARSENYDTNSRIKY